MLAVSGTPAMHSSDNKLITLTGVLGPDQWGEHGEITGFALYTADEEKYVMESCDSNKDLYVLLHQTIRVKGVLVQQPYGKVVVVSWVAPFAVNGQLWNGWEAT